MSELQGFLRTILIIVATLLVLRVVIRLLLPYLMRFLAKKIEKRMGAAFSNTSVFTRDTASSQQSTKQSDTTTGNPRSKKVVGEYIDFEEVAD